MKSKIIGAITLACMMTAAGAAFACPGGNGWTGGRPTRPVVQNASLQASELLERARRLESAASSHDATAKALEDQAATFANRARLLRNQATFVNVADRPSILDAADELALRAASDRSRAAEDRAQASELRTQARTLRQRAVALARGGNGGGGGWRRTTEATPLPAERGVTL
ncbi:MAG: hypothetical protein KF850_30785 [Labilithrix sp.]|nr:hypothetical protein [Labilithrix sp.]